MHHERVIQAVLEVEFHIAGGFAIDDSGSLRVQLHVVGCHDYPGPIDRAYFPDQRRINGSGVTPVRPDPQISNRKARGRLDANLRAAGPAKLAGSQVETKSAGGERSLELTIFRRRVNAECAVFELSAGESAAASDEGHCAVLDLTVDSAVDFKLRRLSAPRRPEGPFGDRCANRFPVTGMRSSFQFDQPTEFQRISGKRLEFGVVDVDLSDELEEFGIRRAGTLLRAHDLAAKD